MSEPDELVLCVPASEVDCLFRGLGDKGDGSVARPVWLPGDGFDLGGWLSVHAEFRRRSKVEHDASLRHISTFAILRHEGRIFTYRRGGEGRPRGERSVGIGGRVNIGDLIDGTCYVLPEPADWAETLREAAHRQVIEELESTGASSDDLGFAGLIAGDETPADRVHLAYVATWEVLEPDWLVPKEGRLEDLEWVTVDELTAARDAYSPWSRIVLDHLLSCGLREARER